MNQLEDMRLFVAVVDGGSFTAAAEALGLSKQFVSRRLMGLEARLGARLLNRSTRRLAVTPLGALYCERARRILDDVAEAEQAILQQRATPRGTLRLSAPMSFGTLHLGRLLPGFLERYPEVAVELELSDRRVDLLEEGYDMAVRIGELADSTLIARALAPLRMVTCASPAYLQRRGAPQTPEALREHDCLLYGHGKLVVWTYWRDGRPERVEVRGRYRVNNGELVRDAALAGLGLAWLPTFIVGPELTAGTLLPVLEAFQGPPAKVYAVYPQHRQTSALIRAFTDYLYEALNR
ncbi:transcription regulator pirR [Azotobacter vinelandii CA]|uniref:Transcription regulator pirR n=2 Tax=Azotobacter vinelandii TaxID=354 RepID=C1DJY2_AZOVD|nr:LysR family transcriptional regulator [Azotobacter vinelandii]ACO80887.1 transcription regulator pirR [Azotobacter vinelandii DJ]AGK13876.1 transcription regulator pirR [Azotobacter vinelandii CA]AGK18533.1 transcription regulator pirR [Azotobacter vinelandii CA6]SFX00910.1 DNA-binding transcriptional regulator, LysR family [Azotobacter vinelandii]GLK60637.1 LysR family transcriptional regulator [Azotobacter vinelandii]